MYKERGNMQSGKKLMRIGLPSFLCLFVLLLSACGGGGAGTTSTKAPASQQIYRWSSALPDIATFDPGISTDQTSINAISLAFSGLVSLNDKLVVQGQLAKSWDESTDHLTYTFHLLPNLKFSDGTQ